MYVCMYMCGYNCRCGRVEQVLLLRYLTGFEFAKHTRVAGAWVPKILLLGAGILSVYTRPGLLNHVGLVFELRSFQNKQFKTKLSPPSSQIHFK